MTHKIKIAIQDGKYVGYAIINNEVVFETAPQNDVNAASRLVTEYIQGVKGQPVAVNVTAQQPTPTFTNPIPAATAQPAPRKCCGRG